MISSKNKSLRSLNSIFLSAALLFSGVSSGADDFIVGVNASSRDGNVAMVSAQALGATSVRADVPWKDVELSPGVYKIPKWVEDTVSQAISRKIEPLLILDYGNPLYGNDKPVTGGQVDAFRRYAVYVVSHFRGKVRGYELWNEWNSNVGNTTPMGADKYIDFAKGVLPALRAADPDAKFISAGPSGGGVRDGWLKTFIVLKGFTIFDGVALHPYNWNLAGAGRPEDAIDSIDAIESVAREYNDGKDVPLYVTEMGWPSHVGNSGRDPAAVANYLSRFYLLASCRRFVKGVWWYGLRDQGDDRTYSEHNFGLLDTSLRVKKSGVVLRNISALLKTEKDRPVALSGGVSSRVRIANSGNSTYVTASWNAYAEDDVLYLRP